MIPLGAVLILQQDDFALRIESRRHPRVLEKHQRSKSDHIRFSRIQLQQQPRETNRLITECPALIGALTRRRIPFIEDEINHRLHGDEPLRHAQPRRVFLNGTFALVTFPLARVIRCSIAASLTRKARAIWRTDSPDTMRRAQRDLLRVRQFGWRSR